jgi:TaqI-like C-terminal specificity domain
VQRVGLVDCLDFEKKLDAAERSLRSDFLSIVDYRSSLGLCRYTDTAKYLVRFYDKLAQRIFEKQNVRSFGKEWYEYHRPRDPLKILTSPKIITPRLTREVCFALDESGVLVQDSCIFMSPRGEFNQFRNRLSRVLGRDSTSAEAINYCLAFLNSAVSERLHSLGLVLPRDLTP